MSTFQWGGFNFVDPSGQPRFSIHDYTKDTFNNIKETINGRFGKAREDHSNTGASFGSIIGTDGVAIDTFTKRESLYVPRAGASMSNPYLDYSSWFSPPPWKALKEVDTKPEPDHTHPTPKASIGVRTEKRLESITAYKTGSIGYRDKALYLSGHHSSKGYGPDATAECPNQQIEDSFNYWGSLMFSSGQTVKHDQSETPHEQCSCGFYAYSERPEKLDRPLLFHVELFGKVVAHERGMRASRQRVLKIEVPSCGGFLCKESSTHAIFNMDDDDLESISWRCDDHVYFDVDSHNLTLSDLAGHLGTEVVSRTWS